MRAYDIYIEDAEGKKTGFMLAKDSEGKKMWRVTEAPPLSPRYGTGAVGYEQFPVEQEMVWAQDDWSGGFGEFKYESRSKRYFESYNCDCRYKNQLILGPKLTITADDGGNALGSWDSDYFGPQFALDGGAQLYEIAHTGANESKVFKWDRTNEYWVAKKTSGTTRLYTIIGYDKWLVTAEYEGDWYYSTDGGANWTTVDPSAVTLWRGLAVADGKLWCLDTVANTPGIVRSCTDPTLEGNWSSGTELGNFIVGLKGIMEYNGMLLIGHGAGLCTIDADGNTMNLYPNFDAQWHSQNFKVMDSLHGDAYLSIGDGGLLLYDGITITNISPELYCPFGDFFDDQYYIRSITHDDNYVYTILSFESTNNPCIVIAGRKQIMGGVVQFIWHPIFEININTTSVSAIVTTRLYVDDPVLLLSQSTTANKPGYFRLPRGRLNPQTDTSYKFGTTGHIITGWWDATLVDVEKAFLYITLDATNLTSARYVTLYYEVDDSDNWTVIDKATVDGKATMQLPKMIVGDEDREPVGRKIRLKIELTTDDSDETPEVKSFSLHAIPAFTPKRQFTFALQCADSVTRLNNTPDDKGAKEIRQAVWDYRKEVWPVTLTDIDGIEWSVKLQYPVQEQVIEKRASWERHILVTATEATVS